MARIKHNNFLDTVNEVITDAAHQGILHLYAEGENFNGRTIGVGGQALYHFGTTGYLGLEQDARLKEAAVGAIQKYGTQFPLSKSYISHPLYNALEDRIGQMYGQTIIITKNSTLGHLGAIPSAVDDRDAVILDHQVHWSVQNACKLLRNRSIPVDMVRHNHLDMLEDKIKYHSRKRNRIWYMADGIYSMYGDSAPLHQLMALSEKYSQLHFYIDDVHGMSWAGRHGTGFVMDQLKELPGNMLLFGTLSKTFGASGAVLVCPDKKMHHRIKTFGGPLTFSAQLEPASVAAASASADIHLSPEIYCLQNELKERTQYFNGLLSRTDLPLVDRNDSPVFYIGTGMPKTGYNFVNRLMAEGFYVNLGLFPAVPVKNTGVRITISRHNQKEEIAALVEAMAHYYPKALEETGTDLGRVRHAFAMAVPKTRPKVVHGDLDILLENSITKVDKKIWNNLMGAQGAMDWDGLLFLENSFQGNELKEHNWEFRYLIIMDCNGKPILATFMTAGLWMDDMLAKETISKTLEKARKYDSYHLTSRTLSIGSLFTEGNHLYLDRKHPLGDRALNILMWTLETLGHKMGAKMTVLRDFGPDEEMGGFFKDQGFVRIQMPDSCVVDLTDHMDVQTYIARLSVRNRRHFRKEIQAFEPEFQVDILNTCPKEQLPQLIELYRNVHRNNLGLNTFSFPERVFKNMSDNPHWEFIVLRLKSGPPKPIGAMFCYKNQGKTYVPAFVGLDYTYVTSHYTYRQLLYQTIKRAISLGFSHIDFGLTASFEKRKLGAVVSERYAFVQASDNYVLELLGTM
ncbi:aminotransferase class I/II-fold pyridoxal phosphate-dependent enzyme [Arenibacter sp. ARW7G5Y1]|uniref:aminotransferase class I/II-fold pyridoxal phosphate-dependent enzyme n=1 Tax=Arenibacter sp. ARW7G5Y1 TaxID=2135619 RepID=UPI000D759C2B|nr:aminotransferase class I/II-fold pyridoxal phosphate-dependent enzyme [Arenibacter sp. ARW7G5Y1]PXX23743.1 7-keto-8-aminopelargonate synthetase-like enzyme [Arenibacter sp. ARW7G5Y1]